MSRYATRLDLLVAALRRATSLGRRRMFATHCKLMRNRVHLPPVPNGYRVVAGELVLVERAVRTCAAALT